MTKIDIILSVIIVVATIKGLFDGFVRQAFALVSLFVAVWFAVRSSDLICQWVYPKITTPLGVSVPAQAFSSLIVFIVVWLGIRIAGKGVLRLVKFTPLAFFDSLLGGLLAIIVSGGILAFLCALYYDVATSLGWTIPPRTSSLFYFLISWWKTIHIFQML